MLYKNSVPARAQNNFWQWPVMLTIITGFSSAMARFWLVNKATEQVYQTVSHLYSPNLQLQVANMFYDLTVLWFTELMWINLFSQLFIWNPSTRPVKMTAGQLKVFPDKWSSWLNTVHWLTVIWTLVITEWLEKVNSLQWNPVNTVTNGPKKIGRINKWPYYRGF